jgi:hypothetical protein
VHDWRGEHEEAQTAQQSENNLVVFH